MTGTAVETATGAREALAGAVEVLLSMPLDQLASPEVAGLVDALEVTRRRLDAVDARVLAEVEERRIAGELGRTSVADLLSVRLRVGRGEARARTARARDLGPRRAVSGEPLEPIHAATSTALVAGQINTGHVAVIARRWVTCRRALRPRRPARPKTSCSPPRSMRSPARCGAPRSCCSLAWTKTVSNRRKNCSSGAAG